MSTTTSEPMAGSPDTLTIHHDYESGTTVQGTTRDSPAHHAIKTNRSWTWSRYARAWLLRSSRHRHRHRRPKLYEIDAMQRTLTALGYTVDREIDETMPTVEQQETDLAERLDDRADRLADRADNWAGKAAATRAKADAVFDNLPLGQPMMPDHYSYNADRNRRERAWNNLGRSIEQSEYAGELARRSDQAAAHMGARHNPVTVGNRIAKLEADRRTVGRRLDGEGALQTYTDEHGTTSYRPVIRKPEGELQAAGKAATAGLDTVATGDWVLVRGQWYRVRRANKKTVSVPSHIVRTPQPGQREYTDTTPWHEVRAHRTTEQMPPAFVAAYEQPGHERFGLNLTDFTDTPPDGSS